MICKDESIMRQVAYNNSYRKRNNLVCVMISRENKDLIKNVSKRSFDANLSQLLNKIKGVK